MRAAAAFLLFLLSGVNLWRRSAPAARRRAVRLFVGYSVALGAYVAVSQRDAWPFSAFRLIQGLWGANMIQTQTVVVGLDAGGREWELDPYTWSPIFPFDLHEWLNATFARLSPSEQATAARFLLERAEAARRRRVAGKGIGPHRLLGSFAAPAWWLYRPIDSTSSRPFTGVRIYKVSRRSSEYLADPRRETRRMLFEYRS